MTEPRADIAVQSIPAPIAASNDSGAKPDSTSIEKASGIHLLSTTSLDSLSKLTAVFLLFVYLSGFLITSLHNFQYGFSEMNPLRPRIIAAGGWFAIFVAVPFTLNWELRKHFSWDGEKSKLNKLSAGLSVYMGSAWFLAFVSGPLFNFDVIPAQSRWWGLISLSILISVLAVPILLGLTVVLISKTVKLPTWCFPTLALGVYGFFFISAFDALFVEKKFTISGTTLWILIVGVVTFVYFLQGAGASYSRQLRNVLLDYFILIGLFATAIYPHIKANWGGGAPIPVELTISNDAPSHAGVPIRCSLIDENDVGFYVIGNDDSSATFIPRTEISSIYYGQDSKQSVFMQTSADEPKSTAPAIPPAKAQGTTPAASSTPAAPSAATQLHPQANPK